MRRSNRAFIDDSAPDDAVKAAQEMCSACPVLAECAEHALTAGNVLDDSLRAPASGVVQAGVVCRGDADTAEQLARVAGVDVPRYRAQKPRRRAPERCVHCGRRMVSWSRQGVPEGYQMHYSRGYCTDCRQAYNRALAAAPRPRGLRKQIDRNRHYENGVAPPIEVRTVG